jgi:chromosomal replication initiation ATPase DnaA
MSENKDFENLLKNIQEGLKVYSIKELNEAIIKALNKKHDKTLEIDYVLTLVATKYGISIKTLKQKNARGKILEAKQISYCLLNQNLGLSIRYIAEKIFFNWATSVAIGIKRYKNNSGKELFKNKPFVDSYNFLSEELIKHLTKK